MDTYCVYIAIENLELNDLYDLLETLSEKDYFDQAQGDHLVIDTNEGDEGVPENDKKTE